MPRNYKKKLGARRYKNYSEETLRMAVLSVRRGMSMSKAEELFKIPRRTISNKLKGKHQGKVGGPTSLSEVEERQLTDVLIASAEFGSPLTMLELRMLVKQYLDKNGKTVKKFPQNMPGKDWCRNFIERHGGRLTKRHCQNIKKSRAEKTETELSDYFEHLGQTLADIPPSNILNCDETNLSDDPGRKICVFRRGTKYPERVLNTSKSAISVMFAATAEGKLLPPYVVYKAERLYDLWCMGGPAEARYNTSKSGWFNAANFEDWFIKIVIPWGRKLEEKKVVILDNLSSHLNIEVLKHCQRNNIHLVFLPPNSTHLTQPLDVSFFRPLKGAWRELLTDWKIRNPRNSTLNKISFPGLLKILIDKIKVNQKNIIVNGFRATGIYPLDKNQVLKKLPFQKSEEVATRIDQALLSYLKETRSPSETNITRRKKMLKVIPGTSVQWNEMNKENEFPDEENDVEIMEDEHSDIEADIAENTNVQTADEQISLSRKPQVGEYVLSKFFTKKGQVKFYVGEVLETLDHAYRLKFFRKKGDVFVLPQVEDVGWLLQGEIEMFLENPTNLGRNRLQFKIPEKYVVC